MRKSRFTRYQVVEYLPWFFRHYVLGRQVPRPELYLDLIWGDHADSTDHQGRGGDVVEDGDIREPDKDVNTGGQGLFNQARRSIQMQGGQSWTMTIGKLTTCE